MWVGKLIGLLLGSYLFGFLGAILGFFIGNLFDNRSRFTAGFGARPTPETQRIFFETLFRLLGHMAKADGRISEEEIAQTENFMTQSGLTAAHRSEAIVFFKEGASDQFDPQNQIQIFKQHCGSNALLRQTLIMYLIGLALADGKLDAAEKNILGTVASALGMNAATLDHLIRMVGAQSHFSSSSQHENQYQHQNARGSGYTAKQELDLAYDALGVNSEISDIDLKRAYRKLMSENHPDKLIGQGVPDDMVQMATERSQEIQAAYDLIRKARKH